MDASWVATVTEEVNYGILHCEHIYYFVMPPNSGCLYCASIIDGEEYLINDPDELDYLIKKFDLLGLIKSRCFEYLATPLMKVTA